jgi:hypothetical protein
MKEIGTIENFDDVFNLDININDKILLYKFYKDIPIKYQKKFKSMLDNYYVSDVEDINNIIIDIYDIIKISIEESMDVFHYKNALLFMFQEINNSGIVIWWQNNIPNIYYIDFKVNRFTLIYKCYFEELLEFNELII